MESVISLSRNDLRSALLRQVKLQEIENSVLKRLKLPSSKQTSSSTLYLLRQFNPDLAEMITSWIKGNYPENKKRAKLRKIFHAPFCPRGINVSEYIKPLIQKLNPSVIAVDASPAEIGGALHYAFSLYPCLDLSGKVLLVKDACVKEELTFQPGDFLPDLAAFCFQNRIPLIPLSTPPQPVPSEYQFSFNQFLLDVYLQFTRKKIKGLSMGLFEKSATTLMQQVFNSGINFVMEREEIINRSCYLASRLFDLVGFLSAKKFKKGSVLTLYKMKHSLDFPSIVKTFWKSQGAISELYSPLEPQSDGCFAMHPVKHVEKTENNQTSSKLSEKIRRSVDRLLAARMKMPVNLEEVDRISSAIAMTLRKNRFIERPPGVRATLATREIAQGYGLLQGKITRYSIAQAAYIAFRHRTGLKQGEDITLDEIFKGVFSQLIYEIPSHPVADEATQPRQPLTPDDISKALMGLSEAAFHNLSPDEAIPVDDPAFAEEAMQHPLVQQAIKDAMEKGLLNNSPQNYQDLISELEERDYLELLDSSHVTFNKNARDNIKKSLEESLARGELSPELLAEKLNSAMSMPPPPGLANEKMFLPPQAETELLAEMMDFQHEGRSSSSSLEDLYVHYTLNEKKGIKVSSEKVDYEKLKIMLHQLEKKGVVNISGGKKRFTLSSLALEKLLEGLIRRQESQVLEKRAFRREHETDKTEVRRYKRGDTFSDLSIRHTLRRIIRKGKNVQDINYTDLRSFEKKPSNQLDIAVCVDISASMKESGKLRYAKMAVAELAKAAIEKHDRMGIIAFSNLGEVVVPLTDKITPVLDAIMTLRAEQYTNIGNGLACARKMLIKDKQSNPKYIIVITDGQPNAALSDDYETTSYHQRVAEFSRQTNMETKQELGIRHALAEAVKTSRKHIKISVVFICPEDSQDEKSEKTAREIARIGSGKFQKVKAIERLPLEALAVVG